MIEKRGNFWEELGDAHVITTNGTVKSDGACVLGRGIALQARQKFLGIDKHLGSLIKSKGNVVHALGEWSDEIGRWYNLYSFPVKHDWWEPADIELIKTSARSLSAMVSADKIVLVRPGCGNGGLSWDITVRSILEPILDDRFVVIER